MPEIKKLMNDETMASSNDVKSPQSTERTAVAVRVLSIFDTKRTERDEEKDLFRNRTLQNYLDDNVKRFVQFKKRPAHKKKWQSNLASTTPYEKLIGMLSKLATQAMEAKALSTKEISQVEITKEKIINLLAKAAGRKNNDDFQLILEMLEAGEKGTVIGYEDWFFGKKKFREIQDIDPLTGEMKFKEKTINEWNDVRGRLINLEDFYPGNLHVRPGEIQDMDDCFLRLLLTEDEFDAEFKGYVDADLVRADTTSTVNESTPFWKQSDDVGNNMVQMLYYFNKHTDEYVILANDIWINPLGKDGIQPLPWNHKKLPFWAAVFSPFDAGFFYGRSMIDVLISFVDSKDALFDRILDQATLSVSRPIITDGKAASAMTKGFLQPNNVIVTDWTNGRPNFDVVPIQDPSPASITMYQILQENLERAVIPTEQIGGGGASTKKTATQATIEQEGAQQLVSLFLTFMEHGIKNKYRLRYANMLQFYTLPSNKGQSGARFKSVILRNEKLSNGKTGSMQIEITTKPDQARTQERDVNVAEPTEFIEITPKVLRDFVYEVEVVPQSSIKMTEQQRQVLELNYQKVINELYPELFDREYGFDQLNLTFKKDPNKARKQAEEAPQEQGAAAGFMEQLKAGPGGGGGAQVPSAAGAAPQAPQTPNLNALASL